MIILPERLKSSLPDTAKNATLLLRRYGYVLLANKPMLEVPPTPPQAQTGPPPFHGRPQ